MARKKAVPVQYQERGQQIENHGGHSKEKDEVMHEFVGPLVFYEYMSERMKELFRKKHMFFPIYLANLTTSERYEWKIHISNISRRAGLLAVYLVKVQSTENGRCQVDMISSILWDNINEKNDFINQFPLLRRKKQDSEICLVFLFTKEEHASSTIPIFVHVQSFIQAVCNGTEFDPASNTNSYIAMVNLQTHAELREQQSVNSALNKKRKGKRKFSSKNVSVPITPLNRLRDQLLSGCPNKGINVTMKRLQTSPNNANIQAFQALQPPTFRLDLSVVRATTTSSASASTTSSSSSSSSMPTLAQSSEAKEKKANIYFHFVSTRNIESGDESSGGRSFKTERRRCLECPWCSSSSPCSSRESPSPSPSLSPGYRNRDLRYLLFEQFRSGPRYTVASYEHLQWLRFHLEHTHFQFHYEFVVYSDMNLHVVIQRQWIRDLNAPDSDSDFDPRRTYYHLSSRGAREQYFSSPFLQCLRDEGRGNEELDDEAASRASWTVRRKSRRSNVQVSGAVQVKRSYYNPITGQQLQDAQLNYDSDEHIDLSSDLAQAFRRIDDYSDISYEDKQLMKLWNSHIHTFPPYGDRLLLLVCQRFVQRFANVIVNKNLRHNILLHFMHLWDLGLLRFEEVEGCMEVVDRYYYQQRVIAGDILPSHS